MFLPQDKESCAVTCIGYTDVCSTDCERCSGWAPDGVYACIAPRSTSFCNEEAFILFEALYKISKWVSLVVLFLVVILVVRRAYTVNVCIHSVKTLGPFFKDTVLVGLLLWSWSGEGRCSQVTGSFLSTLHIPLQLCHCRPSLHPWPSDFSVWRLTL